MNITCPKCRFRHPAERSCADAKELADQAAEIRSLRSHVEDAWGIIANANWDTQSTEWKEAAGKWEQKRNPFQR